MNTQEALVVLSGGLDDHGRPNAWSRSRLDRALEIHQNEFVIPCSAGTTHKPPILDSRGFPILESIACARYLTDHGLDRSFILPELSSYDTVGNAYFSRVVHADPRNLLGLHVITSEFHIARTRAVFEWIYGLAPNHRRLTFEAVPDEGIEPFALGARRARELASLDRMRDVMREVRSLSRVHDWLFSEHQAYGLERPTSDAGLSLATY